MGAIGGLVGLGGGAGGSGFAAPSGANIVAPVSADQAQSAIGTATNALGQQQNFVNALGAQNGIQNQSNVFNQLQGVANGTGPNPAQAQLAQATGANTANQAALMAGQRGAGANVGLIARQAAQQGAANQQQSAGQAASLQANQSLNALSGLGNLATQQVGQQQQGIQGLNANAQGQQGALLNSIAQANNANVGMQSNVNTANAGLAQTQMQGGQGLLGGVMNSVGSLLAEGGKVKPMYAKGVAPVPQAGVYADPSTDPNNPFSNQPSQTSQVNQSIQAPAAAVPSAVQAAPKANSAPAAQSPNSAKPNAPASSNQPNYGNPGANALYQGVSSFGHFLANRSSSDSDSTAPEVQAASDQLGVADPNNIMQGDSGFNPEVQAPASVDIQPDANGEINAAKGGKVPAMVSPGERYLPPKEVAEVKAGKKSPMEAGEKIPGKPKVGGAKNDYANDTVPKTLEEGGLVLPRSVTQSKNPEWAAHKFVRAHMAKGGMLPPKPKAKK